MVSENYISVKLPNMNKVLDLNEAEEFVSKLLENGKKLSRAEIEDYANLGKDKTIRILNSLAKKKIIVRKGKGKDTKYELLKLFNHYLRNDQIVIKPVEGVNANKSLKRTRFDIDYAIPDYETMVLEMAEWMKNHRDLYPHYGI